MLLPVRLIPCDSFVLLILKTWWSLGTFVTCGFSLKCHFRSDNIPFDSSMTSDFKIIWWLNSNNTAPSIGTITGWGDQRECNITTGLFGLMVARKSNHFWLEKISLQVRNFTTWFSSVSWFQICIVDKYFFASKGNIRFYNLLLLK